MGDARASGSRRGSLGGRHPVVSPVRTPVLLLARRACSELDKYQRTRTHTYVHTYTCMGLFVCMQVNVPREACVAVLIMPILLYRYIHYTILLLLISRFSVVFR